MPSDLRSYWTVRITVVGRHRVTWTSLLLCPVHIRALTNRVSWAQTKTYVELCVPTKAQGIACVYATPVGSGTIAASDPRGNCAGKEPPREIGYSGAAGAARQGGRARRLRTDRRPVVRGYQRKHPGPAQARWETETRDDNTEVTKRFCSKQRGDFIRHQRNQSSCSARVRGSRRLIAGTVRFTRIFPPE